MKKSLLIILISIGIASCSNNESPKSVDQPTPENIDSLLSAYPDSVNLLIYRANQNLENYKYEIALADAAKAFRLDSSNVDSRIAYATSLINRPNWTTEDVLFAQQNLKIALKQEPKNLRALVSLASTYRLQENYPMTYQYVNEALRIDPKYRDAYILKGSAYLKEGNVDLAKSSYETAVQQDPKFYLAYIMLGSLYQKDDDELCIQYYRTAHDLRPDANDAKYSLAYAEEILGSTENAKDLYREMAADTSSFYSNRGYFHQAYLKQFEEEELDSAVYFYSKALDADGTHVESYYNLGLCYTEKQLTSQAISAYSDALKYAKQKKYSEAFIEDIKTKAGLNAEQAEKLYQEFLEEKKN